MLVSGGGYSNLSFVGGTSPLDKHLIGNKVFLTYNNYICRDYTMTEPIYISRIYLKYEADQSSRSAG